MDSVPLWKTWAFWRRVVAFASGVLALASQMLTVTTRQAQLLAFGIGVCSLLISLLPDEPSKNVAVRAARGLMK
jgi:hypothetical protein